MVCKGVDRFCMEYNIPIEYMTAAPEHINKNETYLVINSQLDSGLAALARRIKEQNLEVGKDVFIISYNEFDLNEVVLNGLTTVSTDFKQMGKTVATMILNRKSWKVHCDFNMTRRGTF